MKQLRYLDKMEGERISFLESLRGVDFTRIPASGSWTIGQVCNHLIVSESGTIGYVYKKLLDRYLIQVPSLKERAQALFVSLKTKGKFKAPKGVASPINTVDLELFRKQWQTVRYAMRNYILELPEE